MKIKAYSQKGFTLIEIMVALGISGIVILAMTSMDKTVHNKRQLMAENLLIHDLLYRARSILRNERNCNATFANYSYNANSATITTGIRTDAGTLVLDDDTEYSSGVGKVRVVDIKLTGFTDAGGATNIGEAEVSIGFGRDGAAVANVTRKFKLLVRTVSSGNRAIQDCITEEDSLTQAACSILGGTYDIYAERCANISVDNVTLDASLSSSSLSVTTNNNFTINSEIAATNNWVLSYFTSSIPEADRIAIIEHLLQSAGLSIDQYKDKLNENMMDDVLGDSMSMTPASACTAFYGVNQVTYNAAGTFNFTCDQIGYTWTEIGWAICGAQNKSYNSSTKHCF